MRKTCAFNIKLHLIQLGSSCKQYPNIELYFPRCKLTYFLFCFMHLNYSANINCYTERIKMERKETFAFLYKSVHFKMRSKHYIHEQLQNEEIWSRWIWIWCWRFIAESEMIFYCMCRNVLSLCKKWLCKNLIVRKDQTKHDGDVKIFYWK